MELEFVDAIPDLISSYKEAVVRAISQGLITESEWNARFKNYRDDCGYSIIHYLETVMNNLDIFITMNPIMIDNREELQERFGVKIINLKEFMEMENIK